MGRSTNLRMADAIQILRLLADVAAMKGEPFAQRQTLIDGLNRIVGTNQSFFFVADGWQPGQAQRWAHRTLSTDVDPVILRYMAEFGVRFPILADPFAFGSVEDPAAVQVRTLAQVLPDRSMQARFGPFMDIISSGRVTDGVVAFHRVRQDPSRIVGVGMHRFRTGGKLTPRQVAMVQLANDEMRRLIDLGHLPLPEVTGADAPLSPRLQQVLDLLLAGHAPKRIAHRLNLSIWTVREYIQTLYGHFKVSGRDELMSRFVGDSSSNPRSKATASPVEPTSEAV